MTVTSNPQPEALAQAVKTPPATAMTTLPVHQPGTAMVEGAALQRLRLTRGLSAIVKGFLEIGDDDEVNEAANFAEIGLTSISIVGFIEEVNRCFSVQLPEIVVFDYPNLDALAGHLSGILEAERPETWASGAEIDAMIARLRSERPEQTPA